MSFFDKKKTKWWEKEWQNMPEFVQNDKRSVKKITIHFESFDEIKEFSKLINRKITKKTKYIWFSEIAGKTKNRKRIRKVYKNVKDES